jgi:hypothetical protein
MAAGAPVTVATAQILVTVGGDAGVKLAEIGSVGAESLAATQLQAEALSNSLQRASTSAGDLGANELALTGSSQDATVAMEEQSAAAELFNKKLGKLLDGTTILTKFFKTFSSFLVASLIYGAISKLIGGVTELAGGTKEATKAADDFTSAIDSVHQAQLRLSSGTFDTIKLMRLPDGTLQSVRSYGAEIDALQKKITATQDALQAARDSGGGPWAKLLGKDTDGFAAEISTLTAALTTEEQNAAIAAAGDNETIIEAHLRLMNQQLELTKYLDGADQRAATAQAAIDKSTQAASASMLQWNVQSKEGLKIALQAPQEQETYALKLKATTAALQMNVDVTSQKLIVDKLLSDHQLTVFANSANELNARRDLLGLNQDEIEQLQLRQQLAGTMSSTDAYGSAAIQKQIDMLKQLQSAEHYNQMATDVAGALAQVPENALFEGNLKKAVQDAFMQAARLTFTDMVTKPIADALTSVLVETAKDTPAMLAQVALATAMTDATPAMYTLSAALYLRAAAAAFFFADGGIAPGGFRAFASGGIATQPTVGLVGEGNYNEAVVPLPDGKSIPVQMQGGGNGGGDFHVHVHMNVAAIDSRDFRAHLSQNADHVGDLIVAQMRGRNRGLLDRTRMAARGRS